MQSKHLFELPEVEGRDFHDRADAIYIGRKNRVPQDRRLPLGKIMEQAIEIEAPSVLDLNQFWGNATVVCEGEGGLLGITGEMKEGRRITIVSRCPSLTVFGLVIGFGEAINAVWLDGHPRVWVGGGGGLAPDEFVPYEGADKDVDLGEQGLKAGKIEVDLPDGVAKIEGEKLVSGAVESADIASGAVTAEKLGADVVKMPEATENDLLIGGEEGWEKKPLSDFVLEGDARLSDARTPLAHNHSASDITSGTLSVERGGTGATTHTSGNVLIGAGTGAITSVSRSGVDTRASFPPASHTHGSLTNDGKVGVTANLPLITGTGGLVQAGAFGTTANTFAQGNDSRLSDARTPLSHTHGNLTNDGKVGTESDKVVTTTTGGAVTTSSRSGIDSRTSFPPATHTHGIGDVTNLQTALDGKSATTHSHTLAGDVSGDLGTTSIGDNKVTNAKLAKMATKTLKGNSTAGSADPQDLSASDVRTLLNVADGANKYTHPNHTGDVTSTGDGATSIGDNKVTNAKMAKMATKTLKGNSTAGSADPQDLSASDVVGMLKGTTANTLAEGNDSRLSDAREWTASTVTKAEAEAGTDTTRKAWTVERVWQAIAKATSGIVSSMWQTVSGKTQLITAQDIDMRNKKITNAGAGTEAGDLVKYEQAVLRLSGNVARSFIINTATPLDLGAPEWVAIKLPILKSPTGNRDLSLTFSISGISTTNLFRAHISFRTSGNSRSLLVYKLTGDYADNSFKLVSDATHHYLLYYRTKSYITLHLHLVERFESLEAGWNNPSFYTVTKGVSLQDYTEHITTDGVFPPHSHGNLTDDGKVGTESGLPVVTGAGGAVTTGKGTVENLITAGSIARGTITISGHSRENQFVRQCLGTMRIHHVSSALINNGETLFTLPSNWITGPQGVDRYYRLTNINCVGGTSNPPFIPVYVNPINGNVVYRGDVNFGQANTLTDATYSLAPIIEVI